MEGGAAVKGRVPVVDCQIGYPSYGYVVKAVQNALLRKHLRRRTEHVVKDDMLSRVTHVHARVTGGRVRARVVRVGAEQVRGT